jgi:hypothetical protein
MTNQTQVQPWTVDSAPERYYVSRGSEVIAEADTYEYAQQIARAVNSHADLLAALEALVGMVENDYSWTVIDEARAAIRRARGED